MNKVKNPKKNQYQILVIICIILFVAYTYFFYIACRLHNHFKMWLQGSLAALWCFCGIVWFLQLKKINRQEKENES